eukprot:NODE_56_length_28873_cov_1.243101.p11 type:complete len:200 gc:universal NODE_56_length_28873_cov_1.243101:10402-11001(+)
MSQVPVDLPDSTNSRKLKISGLFVALFGGSNSHSKFDLTSVELSRLFYKNNYNIVYGGGKVGPMGTGPLELSKLGGQTIAVIPKVWECESPGHTILVETLAERKKLFFEYACAFVAIPGGFGTVDEVCEYITWRQMGLHKKPIILLNCDNYFDGFIAWIDHAHNEGLIRETCKEIITVCSTVDQVIDVLNKYQNLAPRF